MHNTAHALRLLGSYKKILFWLANDFLSLLDFNWHCRSVKNETLRQKRWFQFSHRKLPIDM